MNTDARIRSRAYDLLDEIFRARHRLWTEPPETLSEMTPIQLEKVMSYLDLSLDEPEEIPPPPGRATRPGLQIAGTLDRRHRRIQIAQNLRPEVQRFTLAHELGHYILHCEIKQDRHFPLNGGERANRTSRPPMEQEADIFASEFLMPSHVVKEKFYERYSNVVDGTQVDEDLAFYLGVGNSKEIDPLELASRDVEYRALLVANSNSFAGKRFVPLAKLFKVSPSAMAIQLKDLRLVI